MLVRLINAGPHPASKERRKRRSDYRGYTQIARGPGCWISREGTVGGIPIYIIDFVSAEPFASDGYQSGEREKGGGGRNNKIT